jgi:hypothetical protein
MADNISLRVSKESATGPLKALLTRAASVRGWINRYAYPTVIEHQRMRWASEGATEGDSWKPLNARYERYKLKKFAGYPGAGRKMLIATNRLVEGMTGDNPRHHYKLVTEKRLEVGTTIEYAKYVNEMRNIVDLAPETIQDLRDNLKKYLAGQ